MYSNFAMIEKRQTEIFEFNQWRNTDTINDSMELEQKKADNR